MTVAEHTASLRQIWPLLTVQDIERSVEFYRNRLGFTVVGRAESDDRCFGAVLNVVGRRSCSNRRKTKTGLRKAVVEGSVYISSAMMLTRYMPNYRRGACN